METQRRRMHVVAVAIGTGRRRMRAVAVAIGTGTGGRKRPYSNFIYIIRVKGVFIILPNLLGGPAFLLGAPSNSLGKTGNANIHPHRLDDLATSPRKSPPCG